MKTEFKFATGNYLNIYDDLGRYDIFVIFNEANEKPTKAEFVALQYMVKEEMEDIIQKKYLDNYIIINSIRRAVEESEFNCIKYGVQVIMNVWEPEEE